MEKEKKYDRNGRLIFEDEYLNGEKNEINYCYTYFIFLINLIIS